MDCLTAAAESTCCSQPWTPTEKKVEGLGTPFPHCTILCKCTVLNGEVSISDVDFF